jgi:hypothetical protein
MATHQKGSWSMRATIRGTDRAPWIHAVGGKDRGGVLWHPTEKYPRWAAICPGERVDEHGGVFLRCVKHCLAPIFSESNFAVQVQEKISKV